MEQLGDPGPVRVVDETRHVKRGTSTVGVQRQHIGTAGPIENPQVAAYLTYATPRGYALVDPALYQPEAWTDDPDRAPASVRWKVEKSFAGSKDLAAP